MHVPNLLEAVDLVLKLRAEERRKQEAMQKARGRG